MTLLLIVPAPVSTNALYANVPGRGRRKTRAYRSWIDAAGWEAKVQLMSQRELIPPLHSRVEMVVELPPGLDVDNIKALGDLMQRLGVVANDRDIEHLDVWRRERTDVQIKIRGMAPAAQACEGNMAYTPLHRLSVRARAAGYRAGQKEMRDRASRLCHDAEFLRAVKLEFTSAGEFAAELALDLADGIAALPIEDEKTP